MSASFMATQCLAFLAKEFREIYLEASKVVKSDFYMDDLKTGYDNENDCLSLQQQIVSIMDSRYVNGVQIQHFFAKKLIKTTRSPYFP